MRGYMFRNRWFALLFVAVTLAGVTRLIGTEGEKGAIGDATDHFVEQKTETEKFVTEMSEPAPMDEGPDISVEFTSDEELIDPAMGEDPTPVDEFAAQQAAENPPEPEVTLVNPVTAGQTAPPQ